MFTLLKNISCYTPRFIGVKDLLIARGQIEKIAPPGQLTIDGGLAEIIDCKGFLAFPGIIDGHVHITGGGGENGFSSRIKEIDVRDILNAGITTVVGLLGADEETRCLESLFAKAKSLAAEGVSAYIYTGGYSVPVKTFTGDVVKDLMLIDHVVGVGEVAVADHRSSNPDARALIDIAAKAHIGGLLSGKAGLVQLHIGDGKAGLRVLNEAVASSDIPIGQFLPTHVNRNGALFYQALDYAKNGGFIDLTADEKDGVPVPEAIGELIENGVDLGNVTVSSDANGSVPDGGIGRIGALYDDVIACILEKKLKPELVFSLVTANAAKRLRLFPKKGALEEGSDADILITDQTFRLQKLFCGGKLTINLEEHQ